MPIPHLGNVHEELTGLREDIQGLREDLGVILTNREPLPIVIPPPNPSPKFWRGFLTIQSVGFAAIILATLFERFC